ncbi:MAG: hypothetical protein ACI4R8_04640 [Candidatus Caccovivens sp.]
MGIKELKIDFDDYCKCKESAIGKRYEMSINQFESYCKICGKKLPIDFDICKCESHINGKKYKDSFQKMWEGHQRWTSLVR